MNERSFIAARLTDPPAEDYYVCQLSVDSKAPVGVLEVIGTNRRMLTQRLHTLPEKHPTVSGL